jgi:hypothetical protein
MTFETENVRQAVTSKNHVVLRMLIVSTALAFGSLGGFMLFT